MNKNEQIKIRPAKKEDIGLLVGFIKQLAEFEKLSNMVTVDEATLQNSLFSGTPAAYALIAFYDDKPAGMAIYFYNFSTFVGKRGLYLEDLFVDKKYRGLKIGSALFCALAKIASEHGCERFEWSVLDWNENAIRFYERMNAEILPDWRICRMTSQDIRSLAKQ